MFMYCSNAFLFVLQVNITTFLPQSVCRHNTQMVYLGGHGYDAVDEIIEEIPAEGCSYDSME